VKDLGLADVSIMGVNARGGTTQQSKPFGKQVQDSHVYIGGAVLRPGVYSISNRHITVKQIIISAGGPVNSEDDTITLLRRTGGAESMLMLNVPLASFMKGKAADLYLEEGDQIVISPTVPATQSTTRP